MVRANPRTASSESSNALCNNSRCTWRYREGARNVYNTAIRRAFSPLRLCGRVTADVHGVAPIRHPLAIRDTPVAHTGEETTPSPHHATGCTAHPSILFSPPGNGLSTPDARWKPLIEQYNSGIIREDTVGVSSRRGPSVPPPWLVYRAATAWPNRCRWWARAVAGAGVRSHAGGKNFQRSAKKLMQHRTDGGYDRRQIHPRVGGDDHGIPLA